MTSTPTHFRQHAVACALLASATLAAAQPAPPPDRSLPANAGWQACQALRNDAGAQLACFQKWADAQLPTNATLTTAPANAQTGRPETAIMVLPALNADAPDGKPIGCRSPEYSELSRYWELQRGTDCDTFAIRGYRPMSLAFVMSGGVNPPPSVGSGTPPDYKHAETKIQLSVRTKVAKGLFKGGDADVDDQDSLWFAYTQQSYWQLFSGNLSRPFRTTDHEPELVYIYPHQIALPGGWNYRLSGLGLVHQSNGQSEPLSRSWNRIYLMGAAEKVLGPDASLRLQGRIWDRLRESSGSDDNPGIQNDIGRAELVGTWQINKANTVGVTLRHSLRREAKGSTRIDWMMAPTGSPNYTGLRYHVQLFNGYGDSLLDYNKKRNVLSVGVSLVDW